MTEYIAASAAHLTVNIDRVLLFLMILFFVAFYRIMLRGLHRRAK